MRKLLPLFIAVLSIVVTSFAGAQPGNEVRILHVDTQNFPNIKVHVRAFCGGQQTSNINQVTVRIIENGIFRNLVSMTCPTQTEPVTVGLVLDRSGSVAGTSIYRIKEGAWRFVELFQNHGSARDEGAIFSFGDDVTMHQGITNNIALLFDAISKIYPYGLTTMYDAIIDGLNEVANNGTNAIKAVIVLSDGDDNNSIATIAQVISRAQQLGIPVYCMCLSYDDNLDGKNNMRMIADQTGGMFLEINDPEEIIPAYNSMMSLVTNGVNDCIMNYVTECADGSVRELKIIAEACGLADTAIVHFKAPLDPSLPVISVWFDSTAAFEDGQLLVPVMIDAPSGTILNKLKFKVLERPPIQYQGIVKEGYLAELSQLMFGRVGDSVIVELTGPLMLPGGPDTLLMIKYRTPKVGKDTSFLYPAFFMEKETQDCVHLKAETNNMLIVKRPMLDVACDDTVHVEWDETEGRFVNDIVRVGVNVTNHGSLPATNTLVRIIVPYGMELLSPSDSFILGSGALPANSSEYASFELRALPADSARTIAICIEVKPDNGIATTCCTYVIVERAKPLLEVVCDMIHRVEWSDSLNSFIPEVFPIRVRVTNRSELTARDITAWIHVPPGFEVDGTTPINTLVNPKTLSTADTGYVTWMVRAMERPTAELLTFCVKVASGLDTAECCDVLYITASPVRVQMQCTEPQIIRLDDGTGEYNPAMMFISTTVKNVSSLNMIATRGHIQLPSFLKLGTSDFISKDFPNGAVILPGDSATVSWLVLVVSRPVVPASVCVRISAENFPGSQCCTPIELFVENAIPSIVCTLEGPDTIRYVAGDYNPQPATFRIRVNNTGATPAMRVTAALLQGAELSIDAGDAALKLLTDSLAAGKNVEGTFRVRILDRAVGRTDTVRVAVYAANGGGMVCSKLVYIEAVKGPVLELACAGPDSLVYNDTLGVYEPEPFLVSVDARNIGTATADSVVAEILPPPDMTLAAGEQPAKMLNPSTLGVGESGSARWFVRATPRSVGRTDTLAVQVKAKGKTLQQTAPCLVLVYVPAARVPALDLTCGVLNQATIDDTVIVSATLENRGTATAHDVAMRIEVPSRLRLMPVDQTTIQTIPSLTVGSRHTFTWHLVVTRGTSIDSVDVCFEATARFVAPQRCCTAVRIPALDQPSFNSDCALSIDTLRYDEVSGNYPGLRFSATVLNVSNVEVDSVLASITLPFGIRLATGDVQDKFIRNLAPAASGTLYWDLRVPVDTSTVVRILRISVRLFGLGSFQTCERLLVVLPPPPQQSAIGVTCSAPDTLYFLGPSLGYRPAPFQVTVDIANTGATTISGLRAVLTLPQEIVPEVGEELSKNLTIDLGPGESTSVVWLCRGIAQSGTTLARLMISVHATGIPARSCDRDVLLYHPPAVDSASMIVSCESPDTIRFDTRTGELQPSPFAVSVTVFNNGNTTLMSVIVSVRLPGNVVPQVGESVSKPLGLDLEPGASGIVTFSCVPSLGEVPVLSDFGITVTSAQTVSQECSTTTLIEGKIVVVVLKIPEDLIGVIGRRFTIPLLLENASLGSIRQFDLGLDYDKSVIEIESMLPSGTLTDDWLLDMQPTAQGLRITGQGGQTISEGGTLLVLQALALSPPGRDEQFEVYQLPLVYALPIDFGPRIGVVSSDGMVTISGTCIEPLKSTVLLQQNAPNPFNPATIIRYFVDVDAAGLYGVLEVLDAHGRRVHVLHEGPLVAGTHSVRFDGSYLPSGVYLARLRVGGLMLTKKMLLSK